MVSNNYLYGNLLLGCHSEEQSDEESRGYWVSGRFFAPLRMTILHIQMDTNELCCSIYFITIYYQNICRVPKFCLTLQIVKEV